MPRVSTRKRPASRGRMRIGDDWNAINSIALSQSNPLKAVAEFVENSIDARAGQITIVRGREKGEHFLRIFHGANDRTCHLHRRTSAVGLHLLDEEMNVNTNHRRPVP